MLFAVVSAFDFCLIMTYNTSKTPMYEQRNTLTKIEKIDFSQVLETLRLNTEGIKWEPPYEEMLSILSDEKRASVLEELV